MPDILDALHSVAALKSCLREINREALAARGQSKYQDGFPVEEGKEFRSEYIRHEAIVSEVGPNAVYTSSMGNFPSCLKTDALLSNILSSPLIQERPLHHMAIPALAVAIYATQPFNDANKATCAIFCDRVTQAAFEDQPHLFGTEADCNNYGRKNQSYNHFIDAITASHKSDLLSDPVIGVQRLAEYCAYVRIDSDYLKMDSDSGLTTDVQRDVLTKVNNVADSMGFPRLPIKNISLARGRMFDNALPEEVGTAQVRNGDIIRYPSTNPGGGGNWER